MSIFSSRVLVSFCFPLLHLVVCMHAVHSHISVTVEFQVHSFSCQNRSIPLTLQVYTHIPKHVAHKEFKRKKGKKEGMGFGFCPPLTSPTTSDDGCGRELHDG
jgi:hypothetical protein